VTAGAASVGVATVLFRASSRRSNSTGFVPLVSNPRLSSSSRSSCTFIFLNSVMSAMVCTAKPVCRVFEGPASKHL